MGRRLYRAGRTSRRAHGNPPLGRGSRLARCTDPNRPAGLGARCMRILIVTDAWEPQVNGVVRTLQATVSELRAGGHEVEIVSPDLFRSIPCPHYGKIRLASAVRRAVARPIRAFAPHALHIDRRSVGKGKRAP